MADTRRYVSTTEVAQALGVSVSTVKRWVDKSILPAHETVGGHRKILADDVLRKVRNKELPCVDESRLRCQLSAETVIDSATLSERFFQALRSGDGIAARGLLQAAPSSGMLIEKLADEVVAPAMRRLGHQWASGQIDVYQEHLGTHFCLSALKELKNTLDPQRDPLAPLAIGGGPEHDHYRIPSLLVEMVLLQGGWQTYNFSGHTPLKSFARAIEELHPKLLWISASYLQDPPRFIAEYRELYQLAEEHGVAVAVGGQALTEGVRSQMTYAMFGDNLTQFAAFARLLNPRPCRPRRGRPPLGSDPQPDTN